MAEKRGDRRAGLGNGFNARRSFSRRAIGQLLVTIGKTVISARGVVDNPEIYAQASCVRAQMAVPWALQRLADDELSPFRREGPGNPWGVLRNAVDGRCLIL